MWPALKACQIPGGAYHISGIQLIANGQAGNCTMYNGEDVGRAGTSAAMRDHVHLPNHRRQEGPGAPLPR